MLTIGGAFLKGKPAGVFDFSYLINYKPDMNPAV